MKNIEKIIESIVNETILREDDSGGDDSGGYPSGIYNDYYDSMGSGGGGGGHGSGNALYQTFVQPLTDIYHTAMFGFKTMSATAQQLVRQVVVNVPRLLIPFMNTEDYQLLRQRRNIKLQAIKNKYTEVLKRNIEYMHDHDLQGMAFLLDPSLMLGAKLIQHAPEMAFGLLELVGINPNVLYTSKEINNIFGPKMYSHESILREESEQKKPQIDQIVKLASNPEVKQRLLKSPEVAAVQTAILDSMVEHVREFVSIGSFDELMKKTQGKLGTVQQQLNNAYKTRQLQPADVDPTKAALAMQVKTEYKKHYVEMLKKLQTMAPGASQPIAKAISQINAIKIS